MEDIARTQDVLGDRACRYADLARSDSRFLHYPPSMVAVAAVICALKHANAPVARVNAWMRRVDAARLPYARPSGNRSEAIAAPTDYPRRGRGAAATRLRGLSASRPRRRRDPPRRTIRVAAAPRFAREPSARRTRATPPTMGAMQRLTLQGAILPVNASKTTMPMTGSVALMTCVKKTLPAPMDETWRPWPKQWSAAIGKKRRMSALSTFGGDRRPESHAGTCVGIQDASKVQAYCTRRGAGVAPRLPSKFRRRSRSTRFSLGISTW